MAYKSFIFELNAINMSHSLCLLKRFGDNRDNMSRTPACASRTAANTTASECLDNVYFWRMPRRLGAIPARCPTSANQEPLVPRTVTFKQQMFYVKFMANIGKSGNRVQANRLRYHINQLNLYQIFWFTCYKNKLDKNKYSNFRIRMIDERH